MVTVRTPPNLGLGLGLEAPPFFIGAGTVLGTVPYFSGVYSSYPPGVFYKYFYNHAHRLRLEKLLLYIQSFLGVPTDFLNHFWIQVAVSEVKRPLRNRFGIETAKNL
jgi:hypothetical protein